eukprot:m.240941 g.240941  ORF g.240941 m.240941 type:complete len:206 (-) comp33768_c5_seq19:74-691(-)
MSVSALTKFGMISLGMGVWTFAEYYTHRFRFHKIPPEKSHRKHHLDPDTFPKLHHRVFVVLVLWIATSPLAFILAGGIDLVCVSGVGRPWFWFELTQPFAMAFASGYMVYSICHERMHKVAPSTWLGAKLRRHHFLHHFEDSSKNHAVIFPLWDILYGTMIDPDRPVSVPYAKYPIEWMVDPSTKMILKKFEKDYVIDDKRTPKG